MDGVLAEDVARFNDEARRLGLDPVAPAPLP
jgi:hypothetical protein